MSDIIEVLKERFENNLHRHNNVKWEYVEKIISENNRILDTIKWMEETGGEPDVVCFDDDNIYFADFAPESPSGRRSLCYDDEALKKRKKNCPTGSAKEQAKEHGITILNEEEYRYLQSIDEFDLKTSTWIDTPENIRNLGGALFCEKRYGAVFVFHNGADSYYGVRGWRGKLKIKEK
jgi:hypothetical protein